MTGPLFHDKILFSGKEYMKKTKELIKLMEKMLQNEYLFSPEKLRNMKIELREAKLKLKEIENSMSKGFGKK